MTGCLWFDTQF